MIPMDEKIKSRKRQGMGEYQATVESIEDSNAMSQGLGALAQRKKDIEEAQKATQVPPVEEKPKDKPKEAAPAPVAGKPIAKPKPVEQMPKDELDALRLAEQKRYEERRRKQEEASKGK